MSVEAYNGWTNWETWNANLWIDSDHGSQEHWIERGREALRCARRSSSYTMLGVAGNAAYLLGQEMMDSFARSAEKGLEAGGWQADAIGAYLSEVDWHEIALAIIKGIAEEAE